MKNDIKNLFSLIGIMSKHRKKQFIQLLFLMFLSGVTEIVSLGAVVPFIAVLIDPQQALNITFVANILELLNIDLNNDTYKQVTFLFMFAIIISNILRFLLITITMRFNFGLGHDLGVRIYKKSLNKPYIKQVVGNSSSIIGGLNKLEHLTWVVLAVINASSSLIMVLFIFIAFFLVNLELSLLLFLVLLLVYLVFFLISKNKLKTSSFVIGENSNMRVQMVQEGLGSIRDILLNHNQLIFLNKFKKVDLEMRNAQISNNIIGALPRFFVEVSAILSIVAFAYFSIINNNNSALIISTLGVLVMGLQRLIPLSQNIYSGWVQFNGNRKILNDVVNLIGVNKYKEFSSKCENIVFNHCIELKSVSFRYADNLPLILDGVNFLIDKGSMVGIVGGTGSGKSTLVDLLSALLHPTNGEILVDNICLDTDLYFSWQKKIAYVSQSTYLLDSSFIQNIAFGVSLEQVDIDRVKIVAEQAQISQFIESSENGYQTLIGENGIFLSGGQKQRIGIARALYKNSQILILDEATSALDSKTEEKIMLSINDKSQNITTIIISHHISVVKHCDFIYKIEAGTIKRC